MARRKTRSVRLRGAVSLMNRTREQLTSGIPLAEQPAFRDMVTQGIRAIESFCRQQRGKPEQVLPTPSFKAYQFLKSIDLNNLPVPQNTGDVPYAPPRITGIVAKSNRYHRQFTNMQAKWTAATSPKAQDALMQPLLQRLRSDVDAIAALCAETTALPADLPKPSRSAYQWMAYLCEEAHLRAHLTTLQALNAIVKEEKLAPPQRYASGVKQTIFKLYQSNSIYRGRKQNNVYAITLHEAFTVATDATLRAIVHIVMGTAKTSDQKAYRAFISSDAYADVGIAIALTTPPSARSMQGVVYNLAEVFDKVNASYFDGKLPRPKLVWSQAHTRAKMGHYDPNSDTVLISLTLDDKSVPRYYMDYVMYHELCHKIVGINIDNGFMQAHGQEFHRLERKFRDYDKVQAWLKRKNR